MYTKAGNPLGTELTGRIGAERTQEWNKAEPLHIILSFSEINKNITLPLIPKKTLKSSTGQPRLFCINRCGEFYLSKIDKTLKRFVGS